MISVAQKGGKVKNETKLLPGTFFPCRRSSVHLQDAENELDLRANTLIGLNKQQLQKFVNFDNEYFKQLSNSPARPFTSPNLNDSDILKWSSGADGQDRSSGIPDQNIMSKDRTTVMELRRAYSNLTNGSITKKETSNVYQQAMLKRSKTDMPEIYTDRRLNLPPLQRSSPEPLSRKRLKFGSLRTYQGPPLVEQLPPIQLQRVNNIKNESSSNLIDESLKEIQEKTLEMYDNENRNSDNNSGGETLLVLRHGNATGSHGYTGELKLRPNKAEFEDLIEKSKNPVNVLKNKPPFRRSKTVNDMGFVVASATPSADVCNEQREQKSNFEIRKEYGKNLEKNWFKSFLQQAKAKKGEVTDSKFDLRLELFYSPEPKLENESVASDVDSMCDEKIDKNSDDAKELTELNTFQRRKHLLDMSGLFSSTDVLTGEDHELDRDTPSDIEIVLKDNKLVQKKTKHKMRRKRRKKEKRCKEMIKPETVNQDATLPNLTDKELRAIRLNIKKKKPPQILTGKRKFLQAANAVFVAVLFRKILSNVRARNRKKRTRKLKKKHRRVKWEKPSDDYAEFERSVPPPTLKDRFIHDIGSELIDDVGKLNIVFGSENVDENIVAEDNKSLSKYAIEAGKACIEDVARLLQEKNRTLHKFSRLRRHSAPLLSMPEGLLIEMSEKSKRRRRDRSKSVRRNKSAKKKREKRPKSPNLVPKCSCSHKSRLSSTNLSRSQSFICTHKEQEQEAPKVNYFLFHRSQVLTRRPSLNEEELKKAKEIDLYELLRDIDMPAKDIRIQIIMRKMRKQKRKKEESRNVVVRSPEVSESEESESGNEPESDSSSDDNKYNNTYISPFVSAGVAWNKPTKAPRWNQSDVDRELKRVTRFFLEMKDCSYIRWTGLNQAIIARLDEIRS